MDFKLQAAQEFLAGETLCGLAKRHDTYFGRKVIVRLVEQRATGQFLKVEGLPEIVVSVPGWMIDPLVCAGMRTGQPQVDLAALSDLKRLVTPTAAPSNSRSDNGFAREEAARQHKPQR